MPWSIWGGGYDGSTQVIVGTVTQYKSGVFKLTFPLSENTAPEYLRWHHLLGEQPWRGITLRPRAERYVDPAAQTRAGTAHGAGLAVGARHFNFTVL